MMIKLKVCFFIFNFALMIIYLSLYLHIQNRQNNSPSVNACDDFISYFQCGIQIDQELNQVQD